MVALPVIQTMAEARIVAFADDPITFDQFLHLTCDRDAELINGAIEHAPAACHQWIRDSGVRAVRSAEIAAYPAATVEPGSTPVA